jgi:hypothetical protein
MKKHIWDIVISAAFVVFSLAIWLPSQYYPLFWDSTYVVLTAKGISDSHFTNFASNQLGYAHTTLLSTTLALVWKFFGYSTQVSHLLMLPLLPLLLISTYFLLKKHVRNELALIGTVIIACLPTVLAEYVNVYVDLPTAAFSIFALSLWEYNHKRWYIIPFLIAILTKLTALIIAPYFIVSALMEKKNRLQTCFFPLITTVIWFVYHRIVTGWWFNIRSNPAQHLAIFNGVKQLSIGYASVLFQFFTNQGKWILTIIIITGIVWLISQHRLKKWLTNRVTVASLAMVVLGILFFTVTGEYSARYAILMYPAYILLLMTIVEQFVSSYSSARYFIYGSFIIFSIYLMAGWRPIEKAITSTRFQPPTDLGIIDYIYVFRWISYYAQSANDGQTEFYGAFPESNALTTPEMGFVSSPLPFLPCEQYTYDQSKRQIVFVHPFSPTQYACFKLIQSGTFKELRSIEKNGKWIDVYEASKSATKK